MKRGRDVWVAVVGLLLAAAGLYFVKAIAEPQGVMRALPYILIGLGCGAFGNGLGGVINRKAADKDPARARQRAIDVKDERNVMIGNMAKARGYDMMTYVFAALLLAFALMGVSFTVIVPFVIAYLFVHIYALYQRFNIEKER